MRKGQTLRVKAASITLDSGETYGIGPATRGHDTHKPLRAGDVLIVASDSAANGDTLVTLPCQCQLLIQSN